MIRTATSGHTNSVSILTFFMMYSFFSDDRVFDQLSRIGDTVLVEEWSPATSIHEERLRPWSFFYRVRPSLHTQDRRQLMKRCTPTTSSGTTLFLNRQCRFSYINT